MNETEQLPAQFALLGEKLEVRSNIILHISKEQQIIEIEESSNNINNGLLLMPGLFNAHVHSADIGLRGVASTGLERLVAPGGIKHQYLEGLSKQQLSEAINQSYNEAVGSGTLGWSDFREGGVEGYQMYPLKSRFFSAFGRPTLEDIGNMPDYINIGLRSIKSFSQDQMLKMAEMTEKEKKKLFMHASESKKIREFAELKYGESDILWAVNKLKVDTLVHLTHINREEIMLMEERGTGGVLCIRSNRFTQSGQPPVRDLITSSIKLGIGTDNAMFFPLSLWEELRELGKYSNDSEKLLKMATVEGAGLCGFDWGIKRGNSNIISVVISKKVSHTNIKEWLVVNGNKGLVQSIWN